MLRLLLSIRIGDASRCSVLSLSVSPSWLGLPFGLPVGLHTALLLLLPSIASVSIPSVSFIVFAVVPVVCCNRGGKFNWLKLRLPISDGPGNIYTGFLG
jgi:hypothetical protein